MTRKSRSLPNRVSALLSTAVLLTLTGTGCVTVHGEREIIPAVTKAEASKALKAYAEAYNKANTKLDPTLNAGVETGALATLDQAGLRAKGKIYPGGNPNHAPLKLTDTEFAIPKQAGWPKFFVANTDSNRDNFRWLLVFTRNGVDEPWKASYLSFLSEDEVPEFKKDKDGFAEPVDADAGAGSGLAMAPGALTKSYTDYLHSGKGQAFAEGPHTSVEYAQRQKQLRTATYWTQFADQPAKPPQYVPVALRTEDGGALAFFAAHHTQKRTMVQGLRISNINDPIINAMLKGRPQKTLTLTRISEAAVRIPARGAADGQVVFLNRLVGLTAARGG